MNGITTIVSSLSDLMDKAFNLSLKCCHSEIAPNGHYFTTRNDFDIPDVVDMVFGWADGLTHKYYQNHATGHCSIVAMASFDIEKFEASVVRDIEIMEQVLQRIGFPVILTPNEMIRRGYSGSWLEVKA